MSKKVKVKLNYENIGKFLKSDDVAGLVESRAEEVARNAGEGYATRLHCTDERVIANVYAETKEAKLDNLENNTLLKSLPKKGE